MAVIRNTKLGGTDFPEPPSPAYESVAEDFNQTNDLIADLLYSNFKQNINNLCTTERVHSLIVNDNGNFNSPVIFDSFIDTNKSALTNFKAPDNITDEGTFRYLDDSASGIIETDSTAGSSMFVGNAFSKAYVNFDYKLLTLQDNFEDASVHANWQTSGAASISYAVTEASGKMKMDLKGTGHVQTYWNGQDYYQSGNMVYIHTWASQVGASAVFSIQVTDGTNLVNLGTSASSRIVMIRFNADDTADVWQDFIYQGNIDLSGLVATNNRYITFRIDHSISVDSDFDIYFLADDTGTPASTVAISASADDGANYTSVTEDILTTIGTPGTIPKCKMVVTRDSGDMVLVRQWGMIPV